MVKTVLADLVDRGLRYEAGLLVVLDGSKALRKAVNSVFGAKAMVQRRVLHKRRNVTDLLPKDKRSVIDRRLAEVFAEADCKTRLRKANLLAKELELAYPDAAASLREGLEEMFTVARHGAAAILRRSLSNTNNIESMISTARTTTSHVKKLARRGHRKAVGRRRHARSPRIVPAHQAHAAMITGAGRGRSRCGRFRRRSSRLGRGFGCD